LYLPIVSVFIAADDLSIGADLMKYGFVMPQGDARRAVDLAQEAEQAGWDGFFVWEPVWGVDAWVCLTAAAMVTTRIRLGTMLSPISRMRPWDLAGKTATLDNLSGGRVILSVGLGAVDTGFAEFGEEIDRGKRAELVDEGLDILEGLWKGQPFNYDGKHYHIRETKFQPAPSPLQKPRIPIWMVGVWPKMKSMRRVLRCDGWIPSALNQEGSMAQAGPEQIRTGLAWLKENQAGETPLDVIAEGVTAGLDAKKAADLVQPWAEAGATWWLEALWSAMDQPDGERMILERVRQGPPKG
jgi:alkanesulfonate monooxygenase SsuD/methylene tetrahydromethanopterin reductase-like flavin-dependent oxidoreductase (luciferase family)